MKTDSQPSVEALEPDHAPSSKQPAMDLTTHRARIVSPLSYIADSGRPLHIPAGPCLVERLGAQSIEIIWGAQGQRSVPMDVTAFTSAQSQGSLVLLD